MIVETLKALCDELCTSTTSMQQQVVNKLLNKGQSIVPDLMAYFENFKDDKSRVTLLLVLLKLKDHRAEALFKKLLKSNNEDIRTLSAQGLVFLNSPVAMQACIATINDSIDFAHSDITPSVLSLADMGDAVLPAILHLLNDKDENTRQHAQKIFELVTYKKIQNQYKPHALSDIARQAWNKLWDENGAYRWDMQEDIRLAAMKKWEQWIERKTL